MSVPPGTTDVDDTTGLPRTPARELLKRIDIGLMTGLAALLLSFVGILTSRATFKMNQNTQKASVMPIIDVDLAYNTSGEPLTFSAKLDNVGVGLADIRRVSAFVNGEPATEADFQAAVMSPNMKAWATPVDGEAVNYLRAGESTTPLRFVIRNAFQARAGDYFDGKLGVPLAGADLEVCYCSVFDDCWVVRHIDRAPPAPVVSCGVDGPAQDVFQDWREQRIRAAANEETSP